jgi:hypothetical protein
MRGFFAASTGQTSSLVKTPPKRFPAGDGLSVHANLQKSHRWDSHLTLYLYCRLRLENSAWSDFDSHKRLLRECFLSHSPSGLIGRSGFAATTAHVSVCDQQATAPYPLATVLSRRF